MLKGDKISFVFDFSHAYFNTSVLRAVKKTNPVNKTKQGQNNSVDLRTRANCLFFISFEFCVINFYDDFIYIEFFINFGLSFFSTYIDRTTCLQSTLFFFFVGITLDRVAVVITSDVGSKLHNTPPLFFDGRLPRHSCSDDEPFFLFYLVSQPHRRSFPCHGTFYNLSLNHELLYSHLSTVT